MTLDDLETNCLSSGRVIPLPVLYHHLWRIPFLRFKCPSFLLAIFRGRKQDISIAVCLYFPALFCLTDTPYHPHVCSLIAASLSAAIAAKNIYVAPKQSICLPFDSPSFVGCCRFVSQSGTFKTNRCTDFFYHVHTQKNHFGILYPLVN